MNYRISTMLLVLFITAFYSMASFAVKPIYSGGSKKAAIRGYDTVAYFTQEAAVKGTEDYSFEYLGATWFFSSEENKKAFIDAPEKYMPQYGGYCAYAVSRKTSASSKPEYFTIHENKLYLNYSGSVYKKWNKDKEDYISSANANWSSVLAK